MCFSMILNRTNYIYKFLVCCQIINFILSKFDNIIRLGNEFFRFVQFSSNLNGDMIVSTNAYPEFIITYKERRFFGLKKNGRFFFKDSNDNETPFASIYIDSIKKHSESCFIQLSNTNNNKEYLLSVSTSLYAELYDLNELTSTFVKMNDFIGENPISERSAFFKSTINDSTNYNIGAFIINLASGNKFYLIKNYLESSNIKNETEKREILAKFATRNENMVSCDETSSNLIICVFQNSLGIPILVYNLKISVLYYCDNLYTGTIADNERIFFKVICLKEEISAFMYYSSDTSTTPYISIKKYSSDLHTMLDYNDLNCSLSKVEFNPDTSLNDMMKINDNTFCITSVSEDKNILYIIIITLFDDDTKIMINYHLFNIYELNNIKIYLELRTFLYNDYISFGFSHCINTTDCSLDEHIHYSSLIIFNYPNATDTDLDLSEYIEQNNIDISQIKINLSHNIIIENNIFGYSFSGIKIISISEKLNLYYENNNTVILKNYIIPKNDIITISLDDITETNVYSIEYTAIVKEANLEDYLKNVNYTEYIKAEDFDEKYYSQSEYIGRSIYYKIINKVDIIISDCAIEYCVLCYDTSVDNCIACNDGYYYNSDEKRCVVESGEDKDNTILSTSKTETAINTNDNSVSNEVTNNPIESTSSFPDGLTSIPNKMSTFSSTIPNNQNSLESSTDLSEFSSTALDTFSTTISSKITSSVIVNESSEKKCTEKDILENKCHEKITKEQRESIYYYLRGNISEGAFNKTNNTIILTKNTVFHISTVKEQYSNKYYNISSIELNECEGIIRDKYHIKDRDDLIIVKIDVHSDTSSEIYVQYEVYNPYTLDLIPLDICKDSQITINVPLDLDKDTELLYLSLSDYGYNLFDSNDSFYHDICSLYTTQNGTDITLLDRKNIIYDNNKNTFLCQEGCNFILYNETLKKSKCSCKIKNVTIAELKDDNFKLVDNLIMNTWRNSNFRVLKCFSLIFSIEGQTNNIGSYILLIVIALLFIAMIGYCVKGDKQLNNFVEFVIKKNFINIKERTIVKNKEKTHKKIKKKFSTVSIRTINNQTSGMFKEQHHKIKKLKKNIYSNDNVSQYNINLNNMINFPPKRNIKIKKLKKDLLTQNKSNSVVDSGYKIESHNILLKDNPKNMKNAQGKLSKVNTVNSKINKLDNHKRKRFKRKRIIKKMKKGKMPINDDEINKLTYQEALLYDKRTFFQYYFSLLKNNHILLFVFFPSNDFNIFFMKLSLLLLSFSLYFTINAFFFNDNTMHKITIDHGKYDLLFQIPLILYSTFISTIINKFLKLLALSEYQILSIKTEKNFTEASNKSKEIIGNLKTKFYIFFIASFLLLCFYWYFISGFCAVYKNTQLILIENTFISFSFSMIYPFGLYLFPGMFRIPALRDGKKSKNCLYQFSNIIAMF